MNSDINSLNDLLTNSCESANTETSKNEPESDGGFPELSLEEVLINLKILSKIRSNEKLLVNEKLLNIDNSYFQFLTRWWREESRHKTINYINHVIAEAFRFCDSTINSELNKISEDPIFDEDNAVILQRITQELHNCLGGLVTIKITYSEDSLIQSQLDLLMENIRNKVQWNNKLLKLNV